GEPIFGINETAVPLSQVPGEHSSPTQPIPVKPPEIAKHRFNPATDVVTADDTNETHAKACADLIAKSGKLYNEGPFTPWDRNVEERGWLMGESSCPCSKPPWSMLTAVNLKTGDFAWRIPLGVTDELPEGKRNTGRINLGGPIVTAGGLVFIGATNDRRFR